MDEAYNGTAPGQRLMDRARLTADAPLSPGRGESVTLYPYPQVSVLRLCRGWSTVPRTVTGDALERVAFHEAGHVVLMQWIGLPCPGAFIEADDNVVRGEAAWPDRNLWKDDQAVPPDEDGVLAATCASVFHAGVMAEVLWGHEQWDAPIHYAATTDYQRAEDMLRPAFGSHASGAHAFAQRVALHVLSNNWPAVVEIAQQLRTTFRWKPVPLPKS